MATPSDVKKSGAVKSASLRSGRGGSVGQRSAAVQKSADLSMIDFSGDASVALADCAGMVRVQEVGPGIGAAYEEAAVLYANGNVAEAEAVIEAVLSDQNGSAGEGLWMMLLDLYRLDGQKERFESRVLDYATRFERSPPPWVDLSQKVRRPRGEAMPLFNLAGALNAQVAEQLRQMQVVGQKSGTLRIDLKRVRSFDEEGCELLLAMLKALRLERARYALLNGENLLEMIAGRVHVGEAQGRSSWLLMLELLQHVGDSERFENVALDYAITFEESPPSWENLERPPAPEMGVEEPEVVSESGSVFLLDGDVTNAQADTLRKLAAFASERQAVEVECGGLRRMDFVSAGMLFNILSTLRAQGKTVRLQNVNAMVAALLRVMGVDQVAQVMLRT